MFTNRKQDAFFKIGRHEGISSLWSGLSPTLILAVPATICYFVSYEGTRLFMKDFYLKNHPGKTTLPFNHSSICFNFIFSLFGISGETEQPFSIPLLAGMAARVFSVSIVSPLELIRTKMQSQKLSYYGMLTLQLTLPVSEVLTLFRRKNH